MGRKSMSRNRLALENLENRILLTQLGFVRHSLKPLELPSAGVIESADVDGDGDIDVIRGEVGITWHENLDGKGTFGSPHFISVDGSPPPEGSGIAKLAASDLDLDGDVDVISLQRNGEIGWYENTNGQGRFSAKNLISKEGEARYFFSYLESADLDHDGDPDVVAISNGTLLWFENTNVDSHSFQRHLLQDDVRGFAATDLDGDSDLDILYSLDRAFEESGWLENTDGRGNFSRKHIIESDFGPGNSPLFAPVAAGDVDNDGDQDVVIGLNWFENVDGRFSFRESFQEDEELLNLNAVTLEMIDINNDGVAELVTKLDGNNESDFFRLFVFRDGTFKPQSTFGHHIPRSLVVDDIDGDGDLDAIGSVEDGFEPGADVLQDYIAWYENTDGLNIASNPNLVAADSFGSQDVAISDFDADGDQDVLTLSYTGFDGFNISQRLGWYENLDGKGTLSSEKIVSKRGDYRANTIDLDGDGLTDIVTSNYGGEISWYKNSGGSFGARLETVGKRIVSFLDMDGDSDVDMLFRDDTLIGWYENTDGKGDFSRSEFKVRVTGLRTTAVADIDNDGDADLLLRRLASDKFITSWIENNGLGQFGPEHRLVSLSDRNFKSISLDDLNDDGFVDLITTEATRAFSALSWYPNNGDGTFGSQIEVPNWQSGYEIIHTIDIDSDGDRDIIASTRRSRSTSKAVWFENIDGAGRFVDSKTLVNLIPNLGFDNDFVKSFTANGNLAFGDIDGDGDIDLVSEGAWYENRPIGDSNNDGKFDSNDLVQISQNGEYDDGILGNSTFEEGDWNGDGDFDSGDIVLAFQDGTFVPEATQGHFKIVDLFFERREARNKELRCESRATCRFGIASRSLSSVAVADSPSSPLVPSFGN